MHICSLLLLLGVSKFTNYFTKRLPSLSLNNVLLQKFIQSSFETCPSSNNVEPFIERGGMQMCIAECLSLYNNEAAKTSNKKCKFNSQTGAAIGDTCGENFKAVDKSKKIICELPSYANYTSFRFWKACDYINHLHAVQYNPATNTMKVRQDNIDIITPRIKEAKEHGIKNLMQVGSSDTLSITPGTLSDIAADPKLRESFASQLLDILQRNDFDGVYIYWKYPGCPGGTCNRPQDKQNIVVFFKELYQRFQPAGKKLIYYTACLLIGPAWYLDNYFNNIGPYVDNIVLEMTPQFGLDKGNAEPVYSLFKIKFSIRQFLEKIQLQYIKKILITMPMQSIMSKLLESKASINAGSKVDASLNRWVGIPEICSAALNSSWIKTKNFETQHVLSNNVNVLPMDDVDSLKKKMDWIHDQSLGGVLIEETVKDDQLGSCGCGRMFWLRAIGEFLKGGNCEVKKCF